MQLQGFPLLVSQLSRTLGFDADVMMPLICTSWLTRLLLSSRMLLGPNGWLLYNSTCMGTCIHTHSMRGTGHHTPWLCLCSCFEDEQSLPRPPKEGQVPCPLPGVQECSTARPQNPTL